MTGEENKHIDALKERRVSIDTLVRTEGWKMFEQSFLHAEALAYQAMMTSTNPHEAAKQMGAYHAARNARTWPLRELMAIQQQIETMMESVEHSRLRSVR